MGDVLLLIIVFVFLGFGFFIVNHIGSFLQENQKNMKNEPIEPACVMLTQDLDDEEIAEEVRKFRKKHKGARIILCSGSDENMQDKKG